MTLLEQTSPRWWSMFGHAPTTLDIPRAVPADLILTPHRDHLIPAKVAAGFDRQAPTGPISGGPAGMSRHDHYLSLHVIHLIRGDLHHKSPFPARPARQWLRARR